MGRVIHGPWQRPGSELRRLVESNLRRRRAHREQHWAQPLVDNLNRNVLASAWREALAKRQSEKRATATRVPVVWPVHD